MRWAHETRHAGRATGRAQQPRPAARWRSRAASSSTPRGSTRSPTVDPLEGLAVLGPGVITKDLKDAAAAAGLFYPPDPASSAFCTIGGNVATNAGGLCCVKYGVTADYVRAPPGRAARRRGHPHRPPHRQGGGRPRPHRPVRRVRGHARRRHARSPPGLLPAPDPALTVLATFDSLDAARRGDRRPAPRAARALAASSCSTGPRWRPCRRSRTTASRRTARRCCSSSPTAPTTPARTCSGMPRCSRTRGPWTSPWPTTPRRRPAARGPSGAQPGPGGQGPALPRGRLRPRRVGSPT